MTDVIDNYPDRSFGDSYLSQLGLSTPADLAPPPVDQLLVPPTPSPFAPPTQSPINKATSSSHQSSSHATENSISTGNNHSEVEPTLLHEEPPNDPASAAENDDDDDDDGDASPELEATEIETNQDTQAQNVNPCERPAKTYSLARTSTPIGNVPLSPPAPLPTPLVTSASSNNLARKEHDTGIVFLPRSPSSSLSTSSLSNNNSQRPAPAVYGTSAALRNLPPRPKKRTFDDWNSTWDDSPNEDNVTVSLRERKRGKRVQVKSGVEQQEEEDKEAEEESCLRIRTGPPLFLEDFSYASDDYNLSTSVFREESENENENQNGTTISNSHEETKVEPEPPTRDIDTNEKEHNSNTTGFNFTDINQIDSSPAPSQIDVLPEQTQMQDAYRPIFGSQSPLLDTVMSSPSQSSSSLSHPIVPDPVTTVTTRSGSPSHVSSPVPPQNSKPSPTPPPRERPLLSPAPLPVPDVESARPPPAKRRRTAPAAKTKTTRNTAKLTPPLQTTLNKATTTTTNQPGQIDPPSSTSPPLVRAFVLWRDDQCMYPATIESSAPTRAGFVRVIFDDATTATVKPDAMRKCQLARGDVVRPYNHFAAGDAEEEHEDEGSLASDEDMRVLRIELSMKRAPGNQDLQLEPDDLVVLEPLEAIVPSSADSRNMTGGGEGGVNLPEKRHRTKTIQVRYLCITPAFIVQFDNRKWQQPIHKTVQAVNKNDRNNCTTVNKNTNASSRKKPVPLPVPVRRSRKGRGKAEPEGAPPPPPRGTTVTTVTAAPLNLIKLPDAPIESLERLKKPRGGPLVGMAFMISLAPLSAPPSSHRHSTASTSSSVTSPSKSSTASSSTTTGTVGRSRKKALVQGAAAAKKKDSLALEIEKAGGIVIQPCHLFGVKMKNSTVTTTTTDVNRKAAGDGRGKVEIEFAVAEFKAAVVDTILLLWDKPTTTPKSLISLALSIPCVSKEFVFESISKGQRLDWRMYALAAGLLPGLDSYVVGAQLRSLTKVKHDLGSLKALYDSKVGVLAGKAVLVVTRTEDVIDALCQWRQVLVASGCTTVDFVKSFTLEESAAATVSDYDYVVVDDDLAIVPGLGLHQHRGLRTRDWLKSSLVAGQALS